jgi:predicted O-methyltransferase YrrM
LVHHGAEETHFLTLLLQCFNARHLEPSLRDHALGRFYRTGTCEDASGDPVVVGGWSIPASVGQMLNRLVLREGLGRTLEIGLAYGISALHLCEAHRARGTGMHTAIDPWQTRTFRDIGRLNVERSGLMPWFEFLDAPDWLALPRLLERGVRIDLAFIDGLHLFDTTLLDFFYCDLILRPGGYLIFDDCTFPGVEGVIEFVLANRAYELIEEHHHRVSVLRKTADDDRAEQDVAFHRPF